MLFRDFLDRGWCWKLSSGNQVDEGRRKEPALHWARLENPQWSLRQYVPCLWERAGCGNTFTPSFSCGCYKCAILLHSQQMTLLWENSWGNGAFPPPLGFPSSSAYLHLPTVSGEELPHSYSGTTILLSHWNPPPASYALLQRSLCPLYLPDICLVISSLAFNSGYQSFGPQTSSVTTWELRKAHPGALSEICGYRNSSGGTQQCEFQQALQVRLMHTKFETPWLTDVFKCRPSLQKILPLPCLCCDLSFFLLFSSKHLESAVHCLPLVLPRSTHCLMSPPLSCQGHPWPPCCLIKGASSIFLSLDLRAFATFF